MAAILLGQLAVAQPWHGRGVGASLLQDAVRRFVAAADIVAARLLVTLPTDATARLSDGINADTGPRPFTITIVSGNENCRYEV